ncbi:3-hydroxybutyryl-CoA dehydrogenase [Streptomyces sp. NPDC050529]|uniref:3-hydroxybutyryl-CoA dehydrogenase n=1 Tax=unclassified Streptomyces TaxID=2593676 RepID=UPI002DDBAA6F|nr:3-hydroxybutyryl-CoA dehydrogenase [Streptomyces sp. NBC_01022]WRZ79171.1 3-hydroxybutyryl-CoA dehydrogenase [Streptomyces sp. NBC_01022]WRZ86505.1 3-hydroxybutyryl-CoA dehydrogenase [Streptomyces sp. NBC_01022]
MREFSRVGVVGCGLMGSGIGQVCARAGLDVLVAERDAEALAAGRSRLIDSVDRGLRGGRLTEEERDETLRRLTFTSDLGDFADRDLVIEAVAERRDAKMLVFERLDRALADSEAVIASNTSSIPIIDLAAVTTRPQSVVGVHFFNPVPVQRLVEVIPTQLTAPEVVDEVTAFVGQRLGKTVIRAKDRAGFVVNALLVPYLVSAVRMLESGVASAEDMDAGMVLGCAHPMGPLRLLDLIGLDTALSIAESMYEEFKEPLYAPPPLLRRMVAAGAVGRKAGRGFYVYAS